MTIFFSEGNSNRNSLKNWACQFNFEGSLTTESILLSWKNTFCLWMYLYSSFLTVKHLKMQKKLSKKSWNHDQEINSCEYSGWNLCVLGNNCHFSWYCCYYNANVVIFWYYYCKRKKTILQFEKLEIEPQFFEYSSYVLLDISKEMLFLFYAILSNYYN